MTVYRTSCLRSSPVSAVAAQAQNSQPQAADPTPVPQPRPDAATLSISSLSGKGLQSKRITDLDTLVATYVPNFTFTKGSTETITTIRGGGPTDSSFSYGKNLNDKIYPGFISTDGVSGIPFASTVPLERPREVGLQLNRRF